MIQDSGIISYFTQKEDGNMSFSRDKDPDSVRLRFQTVAKKLGLVYGAMVCAHQTHGIRVGLVTEAHKGSGISKPLVFDETDALITNLPGVALCTIHADCIPIQFWDPRHKAIGAAHSGWKGTSGEIAACVVKEMAAAFGTKPDELRAAIGPGICQDCYEISADVYEIFHRRFSDLRRQDRFIRPGVSSGKWNLNLKAFISESLRKSGLTPEHITVSPHCTCCREDLYFSHRRDGKRPVVKGAMASIIAIAEQEGS